MIYINGNKLYTELELQKAVKDERNKWIIKMLEIRDVLLQCNIGKSGMIEEVYRIIYGLASPEFKQMNPWKEWESIKADNTGMGKDVTGVSGGA